MCSGSNDDPCRMYSYVRSRQLEGTYPGCPKTGTWPVTAFRVAKGWGVPSEQDWPYDGSAEHWPPGEPPGMDARAKLRRMAAYLRVRSEAETKTVLGLLGQVITCSVRLC